MSSNVITIKFAFDRFLDVFPPKNNVDLTASSVCVRWAASDHRNHNANRVHISTHSAFGRFLPWFALVSISSNLRSVHVLHQKYSSIHFAPRLLWRFQRIYLNRFYCNSTQSPHLLTSNKLQFSHPPSLSILLFSPLCDPSFTLQISTSASYLSVLLSIINDHLSGPENALKQSKTAATLLVPLFKKYFSCSRNYNCSAGGTHSATAVTLSEFTHTVLRSSSSSP